MLSTLFLKPLIRQGRLTVIDHRGVSHSFGDAEAPPVVIRLHDAAIDRAMLLQPGLAAGEGYMDGRLTMVEGNIYDLIEVAGRNMGPQATSSHWLHKLIYGLEVVARPLTQLNSRRRARQNAHHHYDLSDSLYRTFLDPDMQYSCAYFQSPDDTLAQAQANKKKHIIKKLLLKDGQRVLDIGCGWGGMAMDIARTADVQVTGITLAADQAETARQRVADAGLSDRVDIRVADYREMEGTFDRVVSVGMFEHVGTGYYNQYFRCVNDLLNDDGVAVIHSICRSFGPETTNAWIRKYIFPGGYAPAISEVMPAVERSGLIMADLEVLRLHYARTLQLWREAFKRHWTEMAELYDERFCRMWEFYLAASEMSFRHGGMMVGQYQLAKSHEAVPLTRDYLYSETKSVQAPQLIEAAE